MMCHLVAFMILGVGLISPLTPTSGLPSLGAWLFYVGVPFGLLSVSGIIATDRAARIAVAVELLGLGCLVVLLLAQESR
jgi:hypothetical protein